MNHPWPQLAQRIVQANDAHFSSFISGLGDMQAAGEDVFTVLDELGLSDVRLRRAGLSALAGCAWTLIHDAARPFCPPPTAT